MSYRRLPLDLLDYMTLVFVCAPSLNILLKKNIHKYSLSFYNNHRFVRAKFRQSPRNSRQCLAKAMSASSVAGGKRNYPRMNLRNHYLRAVVRDAVGLKWVSPSAPTVSDPQRLAVVNPRYNERIRLHQIVDCPKTLCFEMVCWLRLVDCEARFGDLRYLSLGHSSW